MVFAQPAAFGILIVITSTVNASFANAKDIIARSTDDSFIFSSNAVVSALDPNESVRLGERVSLDQIKRRLPSYAVGESHDCEGVCIHVSGQNGVYLEIDYNNPGEPISGISGFLGSRDILGHIIGMSLIKAIGSNRTTCDLGLTVSCASKSIKNLSYDVNEEGCPEEDRITVGKGPTFQYHLAECMTVGGMHISSEATKE